MKRQPRHKDLIRLLLALTLLLLLLFTGYFFLYIPSSRPWLTYMILLLTVIAIIQKRKADKETHRDQKD
ncbi:MAG TPA: hypothetical protein VHK91_09450 [Flavisolibacter sp.]|jgi:MFS superfamily sulfate permease-like transporter|nr:hypothetical protein [Flavisolibacter sp.]